MFGGCFQWVLDADRQAVEWLSQPLGFNSLALRSHSTFTLLLDTVSAAFMIESGGRRSAPILRKAPDDYRGFRVSTGYVFMNAPSALALVIIGVLFNRMAPVLWVIALLSTIAVIHRMRYT